MKTKITIVIALFITIGSFAQNGINYKALIKDANGNVLANQNLDIVFNIQHESVSIYSESQQILTDNNGIAIATIGDGSEITGTFDAIDWKLRQLELNVQIDLGNGLIDFGNSAFNAVPYAINTLKPQGLEALDQGNGIGWRLANSDSNNHGNIGKNALDFSEQPSPISLGATGELSVAFGRFSDASGYSSLAMGDMSRAEGEQSFAFGEGATTTGDFSVAIGFSNLANGDYSGSFGRSNLVYGDYSFSSGRSNQISSDSPNSFAFGESNTISGSRSIAFGSNNDINNSDSYAFGYNNNVGNYQSYAFGNNNNLAYPNSFVLGSNNISSDNTTYAFGFNNQNLESLTFTLGHDLTAFSSREIVFGQHNTTYTPVAESNSWVGNSNRLFVVANGYLNIAGGVVRRNALTILKSGNIGIGTDTPQERLHIDGRLSIGNETIEDGGSDVLAFSSSLVPTVDGVDRLGGPNRRWFDVYAVNGAIQTSDRREKKNIKSLNYGLAEVLQMKPVSFNWKNKNNPDTKIGLIAQDLQNLIPEVVISHTWEKDETTGVLTKKELDRLGVYYSDLVPILINAIKEQNKIILNQGEALKSSHTNYQALLSRIEIIESKSSN